MNKIVIGICIVFLFVYLILSFVSQRKRAENFAQIQEKLSVGSLIIFSNGLRGKIEALDKTSMKVRCGESLLEAERACVQAIIGEKE